MSDSVETKASDESLGAFLKRVRESRGLSLEDLSQKTRIPQEHLQKIEAGEWSKFPVEAYVRGYLNSISKTLGLDMPKVLADYSKEAGSSYSREFLAAEEDVSRDSFSGGKLSNGKGSSKVLIAVVVVLAVAAAACFYFLNSEKGALPNVPESPAPATVEEDSSAFDAEVPDGAETVPPESLAVEPVDTLSKTADTVAKKAPAKVSSATTFIGSSDSKTETAEPAQEDSNKLTISVSGNDSSAVSWIGIYHSLNDNKVLREGNLNTARSKISYSDGDTLCIVIGNPDAVGEMFINGKRTSVPIRKGYASRFCVAPNGKFTRR